LSVLIREIDKEIYAKFKAKAIEQGLKVGEALTRAMKEWIKSNETVSEEEAMSKKNLFVYRTLIKDLEKSHPSKWGLISNGELQCIKDTREELAQELEHRNLSGSPCLMFQIGVKVRKRTFGIGSRIK
jgi:hypothetical protein